MKKVLVAGRINQAGIDLLAARDDVEFSVVEGDADELVRAIHDAHGIVVRTARITRELIAAAPVLEVVARHGVGYDGVDVAALTERGIPLTITIHGNAIAVAEHAMLMLLALAKRAAHYDRETRAGRWESRNAFDAGELHGRTLLVLGFGRIGTRVAPLARAFSMRVLVCDPYVDQATITGAGFEAVPDFRTVLPEVDAVTVHTPLNDETRGIIGQRELAALKPGAIVVNTARGGIVDEAALASALGAGRIAGAGLDVFDGEPTPPPPEHPLFRFDNVLASPHIAGVTAASTVRMSTGAVENVLAAFDGTLSPEVVVNREVLSTAAAE